MTTASTPPVDQRVLIAKRVAEFVKAGLNRPLSEDDPDIQYPSSDGERLAESDLQFTPLTETVHVLRHRYRDRNDVYVAGNMLLYYRMNDNEVRVAPDVFVVFGVEDYPRDSYIVWREGGKTPDFIMEIASPGTFSRDVTDKREIYAGLGVTEYWRFDPTGNLFAPSLEGEQLVDGEYQTIPIASDDDGILRGHSAVLELDICVRPERELKLYDPAAGVWLRNLDDAQDALADTLRQNEAQVARIRELEAQLRQRGIAPPDSSA